MRRPDFDLQAHSTCSDGAWPPADVVAGAAAAGVRLLALTDHDTVDGVDAALAAAAERGIEVVPAIELSALPGADGADVHVLGYRIDHRDATLGERLLAFRADRALRTERMAERLEALGLALDRSEIDRRRANGAPVGRPHLAAAVLDHPDNAERLAAEGTASPSELFEAYLVPGAPAFVGRSSPTVADAIEAIHGAGGVAVWAHPFWDVTDDEQALVTLERFVAVGLDGVEVFYPVHTEAQVRLLAERCGELGLLQTGSTDFHGPAHALFDRFLGFELYGREPVLGPIAEPPAG
jgi:predicted metal-dependent phosphoesterase TrpH